MANLLDVANWRSFPQYGRHSCCKGHLQVELADGKRKPSVSKTYPINKPSLGLLRGNMSNYAAPFPGLRKTEITVVVALPRHRESPFVLVHPCGPLGSRLGLSARFTAF